MSNSSLVTYTKLSPHNSGRRTQAISRITPHCVVGQCSIENLCGWFSQPSAKCSANYGIGKDGRIGLVVDEANRSWCTSSSYNDNRAITIECASDTTDPYRMNDIVYTQLINLCTDICKRNGKSKMVWLPTKSQRMNYEPRANEMLITVHRDYANKSCPGEWLYSRLSDLANQVNKRLASGTGASSSSASPGTAPSTDKKTTHATLRRGSEGEEVKTLQSLLNKVWGTNLAVDGIFGYRTSNAVVYFQSKNGLDPDGIVGPLTWAKLEEMNSAGKKTPTELAKEVIHGLWGNQPDRQKRLEAAGYEYEPVRKEVDRLMGKEVK